ncbi:MAG TPA: (2Fe-2S)-binding protein [Micropepsaceae bacterium]|nr:(2Fe-2S)-binding protein [Micropepsaceae bacterium]
MFALTINGKSVNVDAEPETPLLWVLRDTLGMTGTKFGCGAGLCGACTVHIDGQPMRSCSLPAGRLVGRTITTIESIVADKNHPVVAVWIEEQVPQCGYCQAGQIMVATALLKKNPKPTDADIDREMTNICRCGTYAEIRAGIRKASTLMAKG